MSKFLESMVDRSRQRLASALSRRPMEELREDSASLPAPRPLAEFGASFDLIAEIKPRSPAEGTFPHRDPIDQAHAYVAGGAAVLSVLAEPTAFGGSIDLVRQVAGAVRVPVMAKDFLIDPYQVHEARAAGADGVLLILRILDPRSMEAMLSAVVELGMFCLLEAFDAADLRRVGEIDVAPGRTIVGVNCRDLESLQVDRARHAELARLFPAGLVAVAESGMAHPADVESVAALGYRAALVGSALMRDDEASAVVGQMVDAGRRAVTVSG